MTQSYNFKDWLIFVTCLFLSVYCDSLFLKCFQWSRGPLWGMSIGTATVEVPQKIKNRTITWSSNPTPGYLSEEKTNSKKYMHLGVHSPSVYDNQDMEAT